MKAKNEFILILAVLFLSGCNVQTYQQIENQRKADLEAQSKALLGKPITAFIDATHIPPVREIKTASGKIFFFEKTANTYIPPTGPVGGGYYSNAQIGQAVDQFNAAMTMPGHYVTTSCDAMVKTSKTGHTGSMDDYTIDAIDLTGKCY